MSAEVAYLADQLADIRRRLDDLDQKFYGNFAVIADLRQEIDRLRYEIADLTGAAGGCVSRVTFN